VPYRLGADLVVAVHVLFIAFVVVGGFLAWRWPRLVWAHAPAAIWGALIEFAGWICPLTPLENALRTRAGGVGYAGGFVEHYVLPVVYPAGLTRAVQMILGAGVILINAVAYGVIIARWRQSR
jgi:hypothetical protein